MYKRLPPLNALKSFESAARHLSFTKAADELFVTQAAVSHQIKLLEDFLGVALFKRKNRALELTEFGKTYFVDINKILRKLNDATERLLAQKGDPSLAISVPQTFGIQWLVPRLSEFHAQYPDIEVRLNGVDHDEGSLNKDIDVAIYYGAGNWENLQVEMLAQEELIMLASPELLAQTPVHHAQDLTKHTLIHTHTRDNWQAMANFLQLEDANLSQGPLFSHTFMALQAAIHGQGIVLANRILALQEVENGSLQIVLPTHLRDPKSFYVVSPFDRIDSPKNKAFRRWILAAMKQN